MPDAATFNLMAGAVIISSLALLVQAFAAIKIYLSVKRMEQNIAPLIPEAKLTLENIQKTVAEASQDVKEITTRAKAVLDSAQEQLRQIDKTRGEISTHIKVQAERVELVMEDVLSRVHEVVNVMHGTIIRPVREVSGIVAGVKTAIQTFIMGRRPTVDRATHDEEMFI